MLFFSTSQTTVFAGPSIITIPKEFFSKITVYPPIKTGDLEPLVQLQPGVCVIIDGVFGKNRAITPFECIELINSGWVVIGCSSMGALRAADLYSMGMIGIGEVYNMYRLGICNSDADVAVVYDMNGTVCRELTISLVHVRSLLQELENKQLIDAIKSRELLHKAKQIIWYERTLDHLLCEWETCKLDTHLYGLIENMFKGQQCDPKKLDAFEVFKYINYQRWCLRNLIQ